MCICTGAHGCSSSQSAATGDMAFVHCTSLHHIQLLGLCYACNEPFSSVFYTWISCKVSMQVNFMTLATQVHKSLTSTTLAVCNLENSLCAVDQQLAHAAAQCTEQRRKVQSPRVSTIPTRPWADLLASNGVYCKRVRRLKCTAVCSTCVNLKGGISRKVQVSTAELDCLRECACKCSTAYALTSKASMSSM